MPEYFVIGVGGTGMRCLEAFTHLCAIGMFDNMEINVLSIDTDTNNGNKGRTEQLLDLYTRIKGGKAGTATANSFFTAKLNVYKFAPEYSGSRSTFELISGLTAGSDDAQRQNRALADLLFDTDVQQFNLDHGYRAQTHLGSHLMYHSIVEAARRVREGRARPEDRQLSEFIELIYRAGANARVFILGSIFGGTGASAIPILPQAIRDAMRIKDSNADIDPGAKFGCSLLTEYFRFDGVDDKQKKTKKVVADSNDFSRNCQAALMFYKDDATVQQTYQRMYHVGWPKPVTISLNGASKEAVTGGAAQKLNVYIPELLVACAVQDFFSHVDSPDHQEIVFKSADFQHDAFAFQFEDFMGVDRAKELTNKLGAFLALAHIIINSEKGGEAGQIGALNLVRKFAAHHITDYANLTAEDAKDIDEYMKAFAFSYESDGGVIPGWLFQMRKSVEGSFLLFDSDAFSDNRKQLQEFHFGKLFVREEYQFAKGKLFFAGNPYEKFRDTIQKDESVKPTAERHKNIDRLNERFLAHTYNTLTKLFGILNA